MSERLDLPLHRHLADDPLGPERLARVGDRIARTRLRGRRSDRRPLVVGGALALAAAALIAVMLRPAAPGPLSLADGAPLATLTGPSTVRFSDGSEVALSEGAVLETLESAGDRVVFAQGDGRASFHVVPGGPRRWTVEAGALTVDVVGTRFVVERDGGRVRVAVRHGRVRVRGTELEGGVRVLGAGDAVEVGAPEPIEAAPASAAPPVPEAPEVELVEAPEVAVEAPARRQPRWRRLLEAGDFAALGPEGLARGTREAPDADTLFDLSDLARRNGAPHLAVAPLRRVMTDFAGDRRSGLAALTLGRLQLDVLGDAEAACLTLGRAARLPLSPSLREAVAARRVEANRRAGHGDRARELARAYLDAHPAGADAQEMRGLLER
jgi:transmembrane sensor